MELLVAIAGFMLYETNFKQHLDWEEQIYWFFNSLSVCMLLYNIPSFIWHVMMLSSKKRLDAEKFLNRLKENTVAEKKS